MNAPARFRRDRSEIVAYNNEELAVYVRRAYLSEYDYAFEAHWHSDIELLVALTGRLDYNVDGEIVHLREGEGIFVNSHHLHCGFSDERAECDMICALLHPQPFSEGNTRAEKYILPLIGSGAKPYLIFGRDGEGRGLFEAVCELYRHSEDAAFHLFALACGYRIWAELYALLQTKADAAEQSPESLRLLKQMLLFIRDNYHRKLTLDDLASVGAMCKSSCAALFKHYLHKTPMQYVIEYRLKKAAEQLVLTDKKIIEISLDAGFPSVSYFIEAFRKHYGVSPMKYKKRAFEKGGAAK